MIESDEGTSNPLVEGENECINEEEDACEKERAITLDHENSSSFVRILEVDMKYSNNDAFLAALKWYNFRNDVNYHVTKSWTKKFESEYAMHNERCKWKIIASFRKKIGLWMIKKYSGPHTCVAVGA
ncbi:hypothetical protein PVK06_012162 [Gossypium arboreum]|uniref:Transposase MuDR plant domain-containing protein n=1 Tax=Gossypium arboreum TaxID=29729 RepID=A0ABR0QB55_GOSAR|nr:hypothetical protein PVK06_012162 [Gossypium arboreum]